jgi:hypothetical protein
MGSKAGRFQAVTSYCPKRRRQHQLAATIAVAWSCLGCAPAPPTDSPRSAEARPAVVPTVMAAPPGPPETESDKTPAAIGSEAGSREVERVARALFGKMIGPEFAAGDEASLAPPGYTAQARTSLDFEGNDTEDVFVMLEREPEGDAREGPACVLVLAIGITATRYRVAGLNGNGFACSPPADDGGVNGTEVTSRASEDGRELVINVAHIGNMLSEAWSYQIGYDARASRFVVSKLEYGSYNRIRMSGERATLYPLEGRAERVFEEGEPEPVRRPVRRVLFEELDEAIGSELMRF